MNFTTNSSLFNLIIYFKSLFNLNLCMNIGLFKFSNLQDGWAFAINGFKLPARGPGPATSPDPNSYDSI